MPYRLSSLAEADLDDIRAFSLERWAQEQWQSYYRNLALAFGRITEIPQSGASATCYGPGCARSLAAPTSSSTGFSRAASSASRASCTKGKSAEALRAADRSSSQPFPFPAAFSFARRASGFGSAFATGAACCGRGARRARATPSPSASSSG